MTAYEMRISDWSSDVCSSDLNSELAGACNRMPRRGGQSRRQPQSTPLRSATCPDQASRWPCWQGHAVSGIRRSSTPVATADGLIRHHSRSEEHTSELQSLMRISYAVFCLKKKKQQYNKS